MAFIGRKEPVTTATQERPKSRPSTPGGPGGMAQPRNRIQKLRTNLNDITAELRKVAWPTREETRNLTIAVLGIAVALGTLLGGLDLLLTGIYRIINP